MKHSRIPSRGQRLVLLALLWAAMVALLIPLFALSGLLAERIGLSRGALLLAPLVLLILLLLPLVWLSRRKLLRLVGENTQAVALIRSGRLDEAEQLLEGLIAQSFRYPTFKVLFLYNAAVVRLRRGKLGEATLEIEEILHRGWFERRALVALAPVAYSTVVQGRVLLGDVEGARQWLEQAEAKSPEPSRGGLVAPTVGLLLREGHPEEALSTCERRWAEAEGMADAHALRVLRLLRAFAQHLSAADGEENPEAVFKAVSPFHQGEFDYLVVAWPELRAYFEELGVIKRG